MKVQKVQKVQKVRKRPRGGLARLLAECEAEILWLRSNDFSPRQIADAIGVDRKSVHLWLVKHSLADYLYSHCVPKPARRPAAGRRRDKSAPGATEVAPSPQNP